MGITRLEKDSNDGKVVIDTLIHDAIGRNKHLWQFACFCSAQEKGASVALDGGWGTGKSFFLRQLQVLFDAYSNKPKQLAEDQQKAIRLLFQDYKKNDGIGMPIHPHICVYYDAWLNDNAEDPMRSILHEIITETDTNRLFKKNIFWHIKNRIRSFFRADGCGSFGRAANTMLQEGTVPSMDCPHARNTGYFPVLSVLS